MVTVRASAQLPFSNLQFPIPNRARHWKFEIGNWKLAIAHDSRTVTSATAGLTTRAPEGKCLHRHTAGVTYGSTNGSELLQRYSELTPTVRTPAEFIERLSQLPLHYQPGTRWEYGFGFEVMGVVVESVTKKRLGDYLSERLFQPLGMPDTGFFVPPAKLARVARPLTASATTIRTEPPPLDNGGGSSGGIYSTAIDYLRFAEMLRGYGTFAGKRYLGRKSVDFMTSDQLTPDINVEAFWAGQGGLNRGYGFGSSVTVRRESGLGGSAGSTGDYNWGGGGGTYFWVDPKEELSVVFMSAAPGETRFRMRQLIRAVVLQAIE